jgi:hypothetical protein
MDVGYVALLVLAGVIALAVLWGVFRISPLSLLRIAFPYPLYDRRDRPASDEPRRCHLHIWTHQRRPAPAFRSDSACVHGSASSTSASTRHQTCSCMAPPAAAKPCWPRSSPATAAMTCALSTRSQPGRARSSGAACQL